MNIETGMAQYFEDIASLKKGTLRIGASSYFCGSVLPELLQKFREEYPLITIRLTENSSTPMLKEALLSREIDFAVSSNTYPAAEYDRLVLDTESIIMAVPSSSPAAVNTKEYSYTFDEIVEMLDHNTLQAKENKHAPLEAFKDEQFITIDKNSDLYPRILSMFRPFGITPSFSMHLEQMSSCYYMAAGGFGSTFLRSSTLNTVKDTGTLSFYLIDSPLSTRRSYLYYKKGGYLSRSMEAFIDWLIKKQKAAA